jgi:hypothetical protein
MGKRVIPGFIRNNILDMMDNSVDDEEFIELGQQLKLADLLVGFTEGTELPANARFPF